MDRKKNIKEERILTGLPAAAGIAIGRVYLYTQDELNVEEQSLNDSEIEDEIRVWDEAVERSHKELTKVLSFAQQRLGYLASNIFESQLLMLNDVELHSAVKKRIQKEKRNADFIIMSEIEKYLNKLTLSDDEHFRERVADLRDTKQRLIRNIQRKKLHSKIEGQYIIVSHNLTPADTILFSRNDVLGYATDFGGITSHAAIISRSLKIPAVVGLHSVTKEVHDDDVLIIDGYHGKVIINPTQERINEYEKRLEKIKTLEQELAGIANLPSETTDGRRVELSANAEFIDELNYVIMQGSRGIGLYRTEHLYIAKGDFPTEDEQYEAYREIAQRIYPQMVIIRTFDIGGDKVVGCEQIEENPSLGWRGTRIMLDKPEVFQTQLRAILRASTQKNIKIMFPMISGIEELRQAKFHLDQARKDLRKAKIRFDNVMEVGVMIELPSAVFVADQLAKEVSFFSIGTNDLIQYLLAVDRSNDLISDLYQEFHPAVLRAIKHTTDVGHENKIWVGMCGEMAGDILATVLLLGLGLDELSVVPSVLPEIKKIIRSISSAEAKKIAEHCLSLDDATVMKKWLTKEMHRRYPVLFPAE